ncbi:hypothetical protein KOI35_10225 [Actinoplanes bogorensis]|uniref:Uncharacterized protein n=1 Tax=Paractinoplanes bogorensis TaxID=1610840 RepID=A0ABS5YK55_9ACTN|nr:hypothetical protein [Actinoplanes bogorensis]MBU2663864.1 hypothetical protein [Actinoplanes bogorensis]
MGTDALGMAFESACLVRCARSLAPVPARRREVRLTTVPRPAGPLAEFGHPAAADRLAGRLAALGFAATTEMHTGGVARTYELQRVLVPEHERAALERRLTVAWQWGRQQLLADGPRVPLATDHTRRLTLARYAWQAALLAGGPRRRAGTLRVKLGDPETAEVLLRGARLIGVSGEVIRRQGCFAVAVANSAVPLLTTAPHLRP